MVLILPHLDEKAIFLLDTQRLEKPQLHNFMDTNIFKIPISFSMDFGITTTRNNFTMEMIPKDQLRKMVKDRVLQTQRKLIHI